MSNPAARRWGTGRGGGEHEAARLERWEAAELDGGGEALIDRLDGHAAHTRADCALGRVRDALTLAIGQALRDRDGEPEPLRVLASIELQVTTRAGSIAESGHGDIENRHNEVFERDVAVSHEVLRVLAIFPDRKVPPLLA